jgi:hypothetical protein
MQMWGREVVHNLDILLAVPFPRKPNNESIICSKFVVMSFKLPRSHFAGAAAARARTTFPVWRFRMTKKGIYLKRQKNGIYQFEPKKEKFDFTYYNT